MIRTIFIFLVFFVGTQVHTQLIPPAKPDGFVYPPGRHRVDQDTILIEAFYDPVCPYSRDSWPPLKQALKHYGSRVSLLLHLLPLPYHDNAYVTSRALHIVNAFNANATFSLLEGFFKHQAMFYGAQTQLLTRPEVVGRIVKLGTATLGNSYHHVLKSGFNDTKSDRATRVSFKYSASRGVYGTPTFYVNGFKLPDADDPSDFGGWKIIIDSLVQPHKGASRGRGIGGYSGPQNEYDAPQDGGYGYEQHGYDDRGGYDGPQGGGHGRGSGRGGRGRGGGGGGRSGGFNNRSDGPPVQVVA